MPPTSNEYATIPGEVWLLQDLQVGHAEGVTEDGGLTAVLMELTARLNGTDRVRSRTYLLSDEAIKDTIVGLMWAMLQTFPEQGIALIKTFHDMWEQGEGLIEAIEKEMHE